jgi:hypothetical protein
VTVEDVLLQYQDRLRELQEGIAQIRLPYALNGGALVTAVAVFLALGIYAARGQLSFSWPLLPAPVAAISYRRLQKQREARSRMWRLTRYYRRAVERMNGKWARSGIAGDEFSNPGHVYEGDLNIFGSGSLFELLCNSRTEIGRRGLASYLLKAPGLEETLLRQEAVRELRGRVELREKIATLGEFDFAESRWSTFEDWWNSPTFSFAGPLPVLLLITSGLLAGLVLAGFDHAISWSRVEPWIALSIALHAVVGLIFRDRVNRVMERLRPVASETRVLREGLALLGREQFQSAKLRGLAEQVRGGSAALRKLERLAGGAAQRDKEWFFIPSRALMVGTQLCFAMEQWRREHGESLKAWLEAWAAFEALNALAGYGYENPENVFPEVLDGEARLEAQGLGHPLLPAASCVANDIGLNRDSRFYVISGSNMSGKSTLLRAIGLNAVLALAGAPVRARSFRLSRLSIFASIAMIDSLLDGKSKFLCEVERLRLALEAAANGPVLFLVDEIFSGTNSRDRRIAAEAVVRTLVDRGAIGALSTHDLALAEIATAETRGVNVHMGSRDPRDPMDFDYKLKPGVTQESNALAIARMAGVPV